jgi:hypothetical protein
MRLFLQQKNMRIAVEWLAPAAGGGNYGNK